MKKLWTELYRPKTIEEYVFRDESQKLQILSWIKHKTLPHLLLSGSPGIGKTSLAKVLLNELEIQDVDVLEINASRERGIDEIRDKITNFISMIPFGPFKVVLLDESDSLTLPAQAALRGVMEEYSETSRFILTCNYPNKIIPAIHSRCQQMHFSSIDQDEFTARVVTILINEHIEFDIDTIDTFVKISYPDLRKCINLIQQNSIDGKLLLPSSGDSSVGDYKIDMVTLFKQGKIREARNLVCSKARPEEMSEIYTWLYQNIDLFGDTEDKKDSALLVIKQALCDHTIIADPEINLAACMIRLQRIVNSN